MLSRKERDRIRHQEEIFAAAKELFVQKGYAATTVEDIAKKAEFAKGTIYNYFGSKDDIFVSLFSSEFDELNKLIGSIVDTPLDPLQKLRKLVEVQVSTFVSKKDFFQILFSEVLKKSPQLKSERLLEIRDRHIAHHNLFARFFEQAREEHLFLDIEPVQLAHLLTGLVRILSIDSFGLTCQAGQAGAVREERQEHADVGSRTELILTIFLDGIRKKQ